MSSPESDGSDLPTAPDEKDISLACLSGGSPDESLVSDWRTFEKLAPTVQPAILDLFQRVYDLPLGRDLAEQVAAFSHKAGVQPMEAQSSLQACRFLFSRAVGLGLGPDAFRADLEQLSDGGSKAVEQFALHYEAFAPLRRQEAVRASLFDHGKVLTGIEWRIDSVHASSHAVGIDMPIVNLTMKYAEGFGEEVRPDAINLAFPASELASIRAILDRVESALVRQFEPEGAPKKT